MKTAVVLYNLGGPSSLKAVKPYLYNLFSDPAILRIPNPWRSMVAWGISQLRASKTQAIYQTLGGKSPLLEHSQRQERALEKALGKGYRVFLAMRYWQPRAKDVALKIKAYEPHKIVLLPLYPHYSTSTTKSALLEFETIRAKEFPGISYKSIKRYPDQPGFIQAIADRIQTTIQHINEPYRVLFTAHGIPLRFIQQGDPYQIEIEETVSRVLSALKMISVDYQICYQSRVGALPWLQPYTQDEIQKAGDQKKSVVVVPISFVCENSETLYELDIQYKELAEKWGVPGYYRVPTVSEHPLFIQGLADLVKEAV